MNTVNMLAKGRKNLKMKRIQFQMGSQKTNLYDISFINPNIAVGTSINVDSIQIGQNDYRLQYIIGGICLAFEPSLK